MRKNILIVINSLRLGGGAERIAAEVGNNLTRKGYNVIFLAYYNSKNKYKCEGNYKYLYSNLNVSKFRKIIRVFKTTKIISKICKRRNIDTVISFSHLPNICATMSKVFFKNKAKIIVSVRSNPLLSKKYYSLLDNILYSKADKVVALSEGVEKILKDNFKLRNTTFIHNLQNLEKFEELSTSDIDQKYKDFLNNNFTFINIGRLRKPKGQWYLLRSFKKVVEEKEESKLLILGDGSLRNKLIKLCEEMDIESNVLFLRTVENVFPFLKKSNCFVFSSIYEGFGNVLTEALSQNLPVISTDCTAGPREILCPGLEIEEKIDYPYFGKYGILSKPFNHEVFFKTIEKKPLSDKEEMFANLMIKMMENHNLQKKYSFGIERVKDFDTDKIIKEWEEII